jgi:hypothetical protein
MTTRGIRNNNPGNLKHGELWQGRSSIQADPIFIQFDTMAWGIRALILTLRTYRHKHGLTTVRGIINRWAPSSDNNNVDAYVEAVCDGWVRPDEELPDEPNTYLFLAQRIAKHECAPDHTSITPEQWESGMTLAGFAIPTLNEVVVEQPQPIVKPKEKEKMAAPFIMLALKTLLTSVPTLIRHFGKGTQSEENAKLAEVVVPLAKQALGATNEQEVIERVMNEPGAIQAIDNAMQANLSTLIEAGGGGIDGARKADAAAMAMNGPWWSFLRSPSFWALIMLLPLVYLIVLSIIGVLGPVVWSDDVRAAIAGTIVGTIVGGAVGYYWGQTTSRNRGPTTGY